MFSKNFSDPMSGEVDDSGLVKAAFIKSRFFIFEALVRTDRTLVIHLKGLQRDFQNKKMLDYLTKYISDRIGRCDDLRADFLGALSETNGNKIETFDSLDIFVTGYAPLMVRDHAYVVRHVCQIGTSLIEDLNRTL